MAEAVWYTPSLAGVSRCHQLIYDSAYEEAILDALLALSDPNHWEQVGAVDPSTAAETMQDMIDAAITSECPTMSYPKYWWAWYRAGVPVSGGDPTWGTLTQSILDGYAYRSAAAIGNEDKFFPFLDAGNYTLRGWFYTDNSCGILSAYNGVTLLGTMDTYNATTDAAAKRSINFTLAVPGPFELHMKITGKNPASSGYRINGSLLEIYPQ